MREVYEQYGEHFVRLNNPSIDAFKKMAKAYDSYYGDILPEDITSKILDIGCGMGHFLYYISSKGYINCYGIDISPQQVDFVKKNITDKVEVADAFQHLQINRKYEMIVVNDVIEHISKQKIIEFLALIKNSLNKDGILLIKTDNMSNPLGLRNRYMDITHEIGFTEHSLYEILNCVGFNEISIREAEFLPNLKTKILRRSSQVALKKLYECLGYPAPKILSKDVIAICKV